MKKIIYCRNCIIYNSRRKCYHRGGGDRDNIIVKIFFY
jgi:hypothetical protein